MECVRTPLNELNDGHPHTVLCDESLRSPRSPAPRVRPSTRRSEPIALPRSPVMALGSRGPSNSKGVFGTAFQTIEREGVWEETLPLTVDS